MSRMSWQVRVKINFLHPFMGGKKVKKKTWEPKKGINCRTITHVNYLLVCIFIEKPANITVANLIF